MNLLSGAEIACPLSVLERVGIMEVFFEKIYENFVGTLETVRNREEPVLERCIREVSVPRESTVFFSTTNYHVKGLNPGVISKVG